MTAAAVRTALAIASPGLVLIDSVGVLVEGQPVRDFFALDARGVAEYSYHDPDRFYVDPASVPPEQAAQRAANMETMRVFAGDPYMHDPGLAARLGRVEVPVLVLWGDSDRIVAPAYGQALAAAFPQAQFAIIAEAGHLPQIEQPAATLARSTPTSARTPAGDRATARAPAAAYCRIDDKLAGRSETIRGLRGDGRDERFAKIDTQATGAVRGDGPGEVRRVDAGADRVPAGVGQPDTGRTRRPLPRR